FNSISGVNSTTSRAVVYADHTVDGAAALADAIVAARGSSASLGYICEYIGTAHTAANAAGACDKCGKALAYVGTPLSLSGVYTDGAGKLRFVTNVATGENDPEIEYFGTYLVPLSYFNDNELTAAGGEQLGVAQVKYTQSIESGRTFAADLVDIPEEHYGTEIFAWSFVKFAGIDTVYTQVLGSIAQNGATLVKGGF
ncbi:MAG: hypothetical protein IJS44_06070, partial [Clostridia bacterium]|nr:hypothetical protein [Clostridia bacterium]